VRQLTLLQEMGVRWGQKVLGHYTMGGSVIISGFFFNKEQLLNDNFPVSQSAVSLN
jgi:hypothetical protein